MTIIHIVQFSFKETTPQKDVSKIIDAFAALKEKCVHPSTSQPYLKSWKGGKQSSTEPHTFDLQYAFVIEFQTEEDRKYYLEADPAHLSFVKELGSHIEKVQVTDFTPGVSEGGR